MIMTILTFIVTYWFELLIGAIVLAACGISIHKFRKLPVDKKYSRIRAWLLYIVIKAEQSLGSGTGPIKLSSVYGTFTERYPIIKIFMSLATFNKLVDSALDEMRELLEKEEVVAVINNTEVCK